MYIGVIIPKQSGDGLSALKQSGVCKGVHGIKEAGIVIIWLF
jgi:hypothetical protein